ncbi:MAG TPA: hypothetical protein VGK74_17305 [Symbiobacteriaceae bacterium]
MGNRFVEYLTRFYTGSATHAGVFDEYNMQNREYDGLLHACTDVERDVLGLFRHPVPPTVILTGNAGDGKTRIAREVIESLSKQALTDWGDTGKPYQLEMPQYILRVVQDLSDYGKSAAEGVLGGIGGSAEESGKPLVYLVAANEGKLRDSMPESFRFEEEIKEQIKHGRNLQNRSVVAFNLNLERTSLFVTPMLRQMTAPELWSECASCHGCSRCPIRLNAERMANVHVQRQMTSLYRIVEQSGFHITMRDMLIHLTHAMVGTEPCRSVLTHAADVDAAPWRHVYYENCWASEQPEEYRRLLAVVNRLDMLEVGQKSVFEIDSFILHGGQTDAEIAAYERLFADQLDLGGDMFRRKRGSYLAGQGKEEPEQQHDVLQWLPHCRRKLFFEWEDPRVNHLMALQTVEEFNEFVEAEEDWDLIDRALPRLVCGLNRALTGVYLDETTASQNLYVTSQYHGAVPDVVPIINDRIPTSDLKLDRYPQNNSDRLYLKSERLEGVGLEVDLLLYEYLVRLAEGGTHNVLAEQCELRLRTFKDQLLGRVGLAPVRVDTRRLEFFVETGGQHRLMKLLVHNGKVKVQ